MSKVHIMTPRAVHLGGDDSIGVRRTLPTRERSFVGAWCFLDHYGPIDVTAGGVAMDVAPHPHTGLQTVSWLFAGEIEHRDSSGVHAYVRPGEVNLMTSGEGIAHSEVTTPATTSLHGVQLWVALPEQHRHVERRFEHAAIPLMPLPAGAGHMRVFVGEMAGYPASPVVTYTPLLGAELTLEPGAHVVLPADPSFEYGVLVDSGQIAWQDASLCVGELGVLDPGQGSVELAAGAEGAHLLLLGRVPFAEDILMWWNFIEREHTEIVADQLAWNARDEKKFGRVEGYSGEPSWLPAPTLPAGRLRPRARRHP